LHEVRAKLGVSADGRFSKMRQLAALPRVSTGEPMGVLWLCPPQLPRALPRTGEVGLRGQAPAAAGACSLLLGLLLLRLRRGQG